MAGKTITFVQRNDTHAQIELHGEGFWRGGRPQCRRAGGFARIAALLGDLRQRYPGLLLVECGDEIHGTAPAQWTKGAVIPPLLNALQPAVMVPGNWEWGFGPDTLRKRVSEIQCPVLACNVADAASGKPEFAATHVDDSTGVRVGFIGVTSRVVTEKMPRPFGAGLRFSDPLSELPRHIDSLKYKEKAEIIVLVSHVGLAQDIETVKKVRGIDIVLSGHTHDRLNRPVVVGKTILIQSGFGGSFVGRLTVEVNGSGLTSFEHELLEVGEAIEPDSEVAALVEKQLADFRTRLEEPVGQTLASLHRLTAVEAPMDNVLTDAYRAATGADVAFSHGWRYGSLIPAGQVTVGDLWQIVPTNPDLFTGELTGREILQLVEQSFEATYATDPLRQRGGYPIRASGIAGLVRLNNPEGSRVLDLQIGGEPVRLDRVYRVAGAGEQDLHEVENRKAAGLSAIDALRRYFQSAGPVDPGCNGSRFVVM